MKTPLVRKSPVCRIDRLSTSCLKIQMNKSIFAGTILSLASTIQKSSGFKQRNKRSFQTVLPTIRNEHWMITIWKITSAYSLRTIVRSRSEEHTSELQSRENLVCRLLLEKKKKTN